jgi:hypothetical protein
MARSLDGRPGGWPSFILAARTRCIGPRGTPFSCSELDRKRQVRSADVVERSLQVVVDGPLGDPERPAHPDRGQLLGMDESVDRHSRDTHQRRHFGDREELDLCQSRVVRRTSHSTPSFRTPRGCRASPPTDARTMRWQHSSVTCGTKAIASEHTERDDRGHEGPLLRPALLRIPSDGPCPTRPIAARRPRSRRGMRRAHRASPTRGSRRSWCHPGR